MLQQKKMRTVWLGQAIKELRESARLTTSQVGDHIGKNGSTVSRMENGEVSVPAHILDGIIEVCGLTDTHRIADLTTIRRDATQHGWWDGYRKDVASGLMDRAWMESKAIKIEAIDITYLPGLLQLPAYAESLMRLTFPDASNLEIERWVEMRTQRQHVISRHRPVVLHSIIDEQLLRRKPEDTDTMRELLAYLAEVAERPNVEIRILPCDICIGAPGSFELLTLVDPYPQVGYVATPAGDLCVESDALTDLTREYARIQQSCLSPDDSRRLIRSERDKL